MKIFIFLLLIVGLNGADFNNYGGGGDVVKMRDSKFSKYILTDSQIEDFKIDGVLLIKQAQLINFISSDVAKDAIEQNKDAMTLNGKEKVSDAIKQLLPEMAVLEDEYKKMNIVTKRLDKIRNINTSINFSITNKVLKAKEMDCLATKSLLFENDILIKELENKIISFAETGQI